MRLHTRACACALAISSSATYNSASGQEPARGTRESHATRDAVDARPQPSAASAQHAPTLHVRANTRLELHAQPSANSVRIDGVLLDDLDEALEGRNILLTLETVADSGSQPESSSRTLRTDRAGRFVQALTRGSGRYTLHASFAGDSAYEPSIFSQTFDVTRADVQLQFALPPGHVVSLDEATSAFEVRATSPAGAAGLALELRDDTGKVLAKGVSDEQGVWRGTLSNSELGPPGTAEWIALSAQDAERAAGRARLSILRQRATVLKLTAASYDERHEVVLVQGALSTKVAPVQRAAIGLFLDGDHAQTVLTNERGEFQYALPLPRRSEPFVRHASARFDPDSPALVASRSEERTVTIPARPGPSFWWVLIPTLLSLAFSFLFIRRNTWLGSRAPAPTHLPGVQLGTSRRRAPTQSTLDGVVEDADTAARLVDATLRVARSDGAAMVARVSADGSFAIAALAPGAYRIEARAPGYALEATEVRIPHAGEGSGLRVRLPSLRTLALEAHRPLMRRVFPAREQQNTATVRETLLGAPPDWSRPPLERLSDLVEHTAYAPDEPRDEHVQAIEQQAAEFLDDRER